MVAQTRYTIHSNINKVFYFFNDGISLDLSKDIKKEKVISKLNIF